MRTQAPAPQQASDASGGHASDEEFIRAQDDGSWDAAWKHVVHGRVKYGPDANGRRRYAHRAQTVITRCAQRNELQFCSSFRTIRDAPPTAGLRANSSGAHA